MFQSRDEYDEYVTASVSASRRPDQARFGLGRRPHHDEHRYRFVCWFVDPLDPAIGDSFGARYDEAVTKRSHRGDEGQTLRFGRVEPELLAT